jgi:hypothetical protein
MCVIGYLVSKNEPEVRTVGPAGVDSIGIKWSGPVGLRKVDGREIAVELKMAGRGPAPLP